jgi:uncharacterized protein (DUF305 family)
MGMMGWGGMPQGVRFDQAFLVMMIPHHEGAVEMSRFILEKGKDRQVREWASQILKVQTEEIRLMESLLKETGADALVGQGHMMEDEMDEMMQDLLRASANPDKAFLELMIPHHAQAIMMGVHVLQRGTDERILKLADSIIQSQSGEILLFRQWLAKH